MRFGNFFTGYIRHEIFRESRITRGSAGLAVRDRCISNKRAGESLAARHQRRETPKKIPETRSGRS